MASTKVINFAIRMFILSTVLIFGYSSSSKCPAQPLFPTVKHVAENVTPSLADTIETKLLKVAISQEFDQPSPELITVSLNASKVAYAASSGKDKWFIMVDKQKGPDFSSVGFPVFSSDGSKLAYCAMQNGKWFIMLNDKKGPDFEQVSVPVFSPDGDKLAYPAMQDGKWFVMLNDKKSREFDLVYSTMSFSPDGNKIAYGAKQGNKSFIMVNENKGPEFDGVSDPTFSPQSDRVAYFAVRNEREFKVFVMVDEMKGPEFDGVSGQISFSSDGRKLAYIAFKGDERYVVVLEIESNSLRLKRTFGPLQVYVSSAQPLTMANVTGNGWCPTFSPDGSKLAYGVNGGPANSVRSLPQAGYYYIENAIGNCTIEINGNVAAHIDSYGLVTPFSFIADGKEINWMIIKDKKLYSKRLKLK